MEYAIISVESVSKCLDCKLPLSYCMSFCNKYGSNEKVIKIVYTAPTYREILSDFQNLDKSNKNIKYQIRRIASAESNEIKFERNCVFAILETFILLEGDYKNKKIIYREILNYSYSLTPLLNIHKNLIEGKIRSTSHFNNKSFNYLQNLNLVIMSKKLPTFFY